MRRPSAADVSEDGSGIEFPFGPVGAECSAVEHIHPGSPRSSSFPQRAVQGHPDERGPHCLLCLVPATSLTVHPDGTQTLGERGGHPPLLLPGRWPHPARPQVPHLWCRCLAPCSSPGPPGFLSPVVRDGLSAGRAQSPNGHFDHLIL